jgi:MinD-like ATPase involved in chromosome partitioning or flagellar assembly
MGVEDSYAGHVWPPDEIVASPRGEPSPAHPPADAQTRAGPAGVGAPEVGGVGRPTGPPPPAIPVPPAFAGRPEAAAAPPGPPPAATTSAWAATPTPPAPPTPPTPPTPAAAAAEGTALPYAPGSAWARPPTPPANRPADHPDAGHPQAGHPQAGHPQAGHPQAGHPQAGHPQAGTRPESREPGPARPAAPSVPPGPYGTVPPTAPPQEAPGVYRLPAQRYQQPPALLPPAAQAVAPQSVAPQAVVPPRGEPAWLPEGYVPTAEEFARRRAVRQPDPVATMGMRAGVRRGTFGLVKMGPGRREQEFRHDVETVRRNFGGLRQVTVVNPKGGAGKTVAVLLLAMTFGQKRGGYVLAWDNNETQGTLGMRAQQDFHLRTVRDLLRDLGHFHGAHGRVGDLSQYVRAQGEGMFDVLASDESATAGEMLTSAAFAELREVVSRFYKLIFVDTGNNVRAQNWQAAIDATDQLVVTMSARNDSAETAARMLDHLEQTGRQRLVRQAVTVVTMPPSRKEIDLPPIQRHFAARTRVVLLAPYERLIDTGEPLRYGLLSSATRDAWLKIAASVADGL